MLSGKIIPKSFPEETVAFTFTEATSILKIH
jgi:hypothetical protein